MVAAGQGRHCRDVRGADQISWNPQPNKAHSVSCSCFALQDKDAIAEAREKLETFITETQDIGVSVWRGLFSLFPP